MIGCCRLKLNDLLCGPAADEDDCTNTVLGVAEVQGDQKEMSEMPHDSPESGTQKERFTIALLKLQLWKND